MTVRVYISRDSGALCVGAEEVATKLREEAEPRGLAIDIMRTGSRGMYWLEPLVEVATERGRIGYGPVAVKDIDGLLEAGFLQGGNHALSLGLVEEIPFFKNQPRLTFTRVGITDPRSVADYRVHDGYAGLMKGDRGRAGKNHRTGHDLGLARPRRRGFPHGHQVEDRDPDVAAARDTR